MDYSIEDFLEEFHDGDLDVKKYFNDYQTFFSILDRRGLIDQIDPINDPHSSDWQNSYFIWLYQNHPEKFYQWVERLLNDIVYEGDDVYLVRDSRADLADLFCDGRDVSRKTVENILGEDNDWYDWFNDSTDDVYRDVVSELNQKNLERLKEYMTDSLKDQKLSPETEEMELIASEQGNNDYWVMTPEVAARIIDDEESMNSLLDNELSELKSELYSVHYNAYNSAYENEIYKDVWKELDDYFEDRGQFINAPHSYKKDVQVEKFKIKIKDFTGVIIDFLSQNEGYGEQHTLEYWGSFLGILGDISDCLSPRFSDYPDSREVDENVNIYFQDYI